MTSRSLVDGWERGLVPLRSVLAVPSEALAAARALGERCVALGDRERARTIFAGLAVLDPADVPATARLAELLLEDAQPGLALQWIERSLTTTRRDDRLEGLAQRAITALGRSARSEPGEGRSRLDAP